MATITDITTGVQSVTATGALTPTAGLDISGVSGDFTLCMEVTSLVAAKTCQVQLEVSTNGFTATTPLWTEQFIGSLTSATDMRVSKRKYQLPYSGANVFGAVNAVLRANLINLDSGASPSIHCWLEK